ncbi:MAG: hypothetical protein IH612_21115 [Desulfofustis sp.]|nr:hypothetical protein [Desulfofustis sp.]
MAPEPIPLLGGKSVHCINESQMAEAERLAERDEISSPKIQSCLQQVEAELTRNERAALAFMLIKRLKENQPG